MLTTVSMRSRPLVSTSILGPYEKRTKWWHGESNRSRRREGFRSKKMPGTTITFSSKQAWKKLRPSEMASGRPSRFSQLRSLVSVEFLEPVRHLQVEGRVGNVFDDESHLAEALDDKVALVAEVALQVNHFLLDKLGLKELHGSLLESVVGTTIKIATARANTTQSQNHLFSRQMWGIPTR